MFLSMDAIMPTVVLLSGALVLAYKAGHGHGFDEGLRLATDEILQAAAGSLSFLKVQDLSGLEDEESKRIACRNKTLDEVYDHLQVFRGEVLADYDKRGLPEEES